MAKRIRALIVFFIGEETDEIVRGAITAELRRHCNAIDHTEIIEFDASDIAKDWVQSLSAEEKHSNIANLRTPEDEAVIYIGTIMKNELAQFNSSNFAAVLATKIAEASVNPNNEDNKRFMNALFILSKEDLVISQNLLKKYKLNQQKIHLIKRVYNAVVSF